MFKFYALMTLSLVIISLNCKIQANKEEKIGTILFDMADMTRHCWSNEDLLLLNSRRAFKDILPKVDNFKCEDGEKYISEVMEYFHVCLDAVRNNSAGRTKYLMLKALADTIGGYLKVHLLPMVRLSFYYGNIKFRSVKKLHELLEQLQSFLKTNGAGWACNSTSADDGKSSSFCKEPAAMVIKSPKTCEVCSGLIIDAKLNERNYLPFLDDEEEPNSIALPFVKQQLLSLYSEKSAFVLVKYYIATIKCLYSRNPQKIDNFNRDFYNWLNKSVVPHLRDDKWYAAFGGVYRIISTLKRGNMNLEPKVEDNDKCRESKCNNGSTQQLKLNVDNLDDKDGNNKKVTTTTSPVEEEDDFENQTTVVSVAIVGGILIWLLIGVIVVCCTFLNSSRKFKENTCSCSNASVPVTYLFDNTQQCCRP